MFQLNNKEYRNLEEQVLQNKQDIARHYNIDRVLADFGITVLGRVNTPADLPETEDENWGYGYLVGEEAPYEVYVWTRANPDVGEEVPYWLNIGSISIVGPEGPAGRSITNISINSNYQLVFNFSDGSILTLAQSIRGPQGIPGANGKTPSITATREANGIRVKTFNGDGTLTNSVFIPDGKTGATGPQGPRGENATLNIIGTFTSIEQAPPAETRELGDAFLLSAGGLTTLYVLTGEPDIISTYSWQETSFGGGTRVTVGGQTKSVWNADTKLDKLVGNTHSVYTFIDPWTTNLTPIDTTLTADSIPLRDSTGTFSVATPSQTNHPATKQYVDEAKEDLQTEIGDLESRVMLLENGGGGGGSSGGSGGWNTMTCGTNESLWLNLDPTKNYEMCLMSEHGMGDNTMCSQVFLLPKTSIHNMSVSNMKIYTTNVNYLDTCYWEINFDPPANQYYIMFAYNGTSPSDIHNITAYYREI